MKLEVMNSQVSRKEKRQSEKEAKEVTIVSDVDAHSQCGMRVRVKGNKIIEIHGDPTDPS